MSELVKHLRGYVLPKNDVLGKDIIAAADEIERLQDKLDEVAEKPAEWCSYADQLDDEDSDNQFVASAFRDCAFEITTILEANDE